METPVDSCFNLGGNEEGLELRQHGAYALDAKPTAEPAWKTDLVRDLVGRALGAVHLVVVLLAHERVGVVGHQPLEGLRRLHDAIGVLVEELKKIALLGQELAEQHGRILSRRVTRARPEDFSARDCVSQV